MPRDDAPETQLEPGSSGTDNDLWEVVRILAENPEKRLYLLLWSGEDPETGYEYEPTWEPKEGCTQDLIVEWKERVRADPTIRPVRHGEKILREWRAGFEEEMARRKAARRADKKSKGKKRKSRGEGDGQGGGDGLGAEVVAEGDGADERRTKRGRKGDTREASATSQASKATTVDPAGVAGRTRGARSHSEATTAAASTSAPRQSRVSIELPSRAQHDSLTIETAGGSSRNGNGTAATSNPRTSSPRAGPSNAVPRAASPTDLGPDSLEEATQVDPRSLDDETYRPRAAPSPRKRVTRGGDQAKTTRKTRMMAVPQPDLVDFDAPVTRGKDRSATQVIKSTQEEIQQFSSPPQGEDGGQGGATAGAHGEEEADVDADVGAEDVPAAAAVGEAVEESVARRVVKRIVDGEEVWEAASDEEAPGETEGVGEEPIPESQDEVGAVAPGESRGEVIPDLVPESIPTVAPEPTSTHDQGTQAEATGSEQVDRSVQASTPDAAEKAVSTKALPAQVDASTTMTGIVNGVSAAVQTVVETTAPVAAAPALPSNVVELQARVASLAASLEDGAERNAALTEETTFLREHYQTASSRAATEARRVMELEEELARRKKQLITALKQKDLHFQAVRDQDQLEKTQLRGQIKILLDQARLTDDAIRHKAVMFPRVKRENDALRMDNAELEGRVGKLVKRNEDLMDQLEVLRARQLGVIGGNDGASGSGSGSESESEADFTDGDSEIDMEMSAQGRVGRDAPSGSSRGESSRGGSRAEELRALGYAPRLQTSSMASIPASVAAVLEAAHPAAEVPAAAMTAAAADVAFGLDEPDVDALGFETSAPGTGYECAWRVGEDEVPCGLLAETQEVLLHHYASHRAEVVPLQL